MHPIASLNVHLLPRVLHDNVTTVEVSQRHENYVALLDLLVHPHTSTKAANQLGFIRASDHYVPTAQHPRDHRALLGA